jgi:hypothetical protein
MELLRAALTSLGFYINDEAYSRNLGYEFSADRVSDKVSVGIRDGQLTIGGPGIRDYTEHRNALQRAYSTEVVKKATSRFGWNLKQTNERQFVATRRY